ncbi:hypothetical protein Vadar_033518 [Vaccinium darrowii]|uniref:Uncharacterized protein n=1 Tax=Vaccinium darrowii TaxID=229202 RepID=A0ACB7XLW3_9ERIC|nr:hypothetical protein Vadar_033518 [Vaccinium darrowii]
MKAKTELTRDCLTSPESCVSCTVVAGGWRESKSSRRFFGRKLCMDNILVQDSISDLPQSIVETILTKTPIRDAVRTSILSSKWRYKWANLTHLVFDDRCASLYDDTGLVEGNIAKFITGFLFLHDGPIHMFTLSSTYLQGSPYIDQWLLFLSRKDVEELVIELGDREWFRAPSCLLSCQKLTRLELIRCELNPPPTFEGLGMKASLKLPGWLEKAILWWALLGQSMVLILVQCHHRSYIASKYPVK